MGKKITLNDILRGIGMVPWTIYWGGEPYPKILNRVKPKSFDVVKKPLWGWRIYCYNDDTGTFPATREGIAEARKMLKRGEE